MLPFFTPFMVDNDKHTLKHYMVPVNHNVLNETTWLNIVHTFLGNFCHETDNNNDTMPMEDMGHNACVVVGYHKNVSVFTPYNFSRFRPKSKHEILLNT